jgi:MYXO-CTERM domain-containing protein
MDDSGDGRPYGASMDTRGLRSLLPGATARVDDLLLAAGLAVFGVVGTLGAAGEQPTARPLDPAAWALLLVAAGVLLARRRHPALVLAVTAAATVAWLAASYPYGPVFLPLSVAVYTVAATTARERLPALVGCVVGLLAVLVAVGVGDGRVWRWEELPGVLLAFLALLLVPLWVGTVVRARRGRTAEEARRRADDERLRVARELHDVVSHSIAMINFRAGVALHVLDRRPEQAREALVAIRQASAGAMQELRATVGVLRQPGGGERSQAAVPGLAQLDQLVAGVARAGPPVRVVVDGDPVELPPAVDLAAYRVVQESLTNVVRHAGPASAIVRVAYGAAEVVVEVTDDGTGSPDASGGLDGGGHGIGGMRERVAALGGELRAGPRPQGGFRIWARLPLPGGSEGPQGGPPVGQAPVDQGPAGRPR